MNAGKTLFAQIMDFLPWSTLPIAGRNVGDEWVRTPSSAGQYRALAFAQLACPDRPPDSEICLSAQSSKFDAMAQ